MTDGPLTPEGVSPTTTVGVGDVVEMRTGATGVRPDEGEKGSEGVTGEGTEVVRWF